MDPSDPQSGITAVSRIDAHTQAGSCAGIKCKESGMEKKRLYSIVSLPLGSSHAYPITWERGAVLVDAGYKKRLKSLTAALEQKDLSYRDLTHIVLTHTHYDHVGGLFELKQKCAAKIVAHKEEAGFLRSGYTPFFHPLTTMCVPCWRAGRDLSKSGAVIFTQVMGGHSPLKSS
jgi:glyoxylase-like metal-dependent hydrolase (beta-lactamase superfamily II)